MHVNGQECKEILEQRYKDAEESFIKNSKPGAPFNAENAFEKIFLSSTQAYREVLLGCILARIMDNSIDIHLPYTNMGANAFSGRSLDERVVNPFLHEKSIPCSRGPYLSVFRRNVKFNETTRQGLKDKEGYDALITLIDMVNRYGLA